MVWDVLDEELTADERADIVLLMANTPEESEVLQNDQPREAG